MFRLINGARRFGSDVKHDLVVIGGGPGGYVSAIKGAQLGLNVACVESRGKLGGTCLNVGCIPSKSLLNTSHKYEDASKHFGAHGIKLDGKLSVDVSEMMKAKQKRVDGLTMGVEGLFKKNKVKYYKGMARLRTSSSLLINPSDGSGEFKVDTKNILIATGSQAMTLPGIGFDDSKGNVVSSTGALSFSEVPEKLIVIGGGVIGLELGCVWQRLGAQVSVIEFLDHIGGACDLEVAKEMKKLMARQGMKFHLKSKVTAVNPKDDTTVTVHFEGEKGENTLEGNKVLLSVGRKPFTDGLGLEDVGIKTDKGGRIEVDPEYKTSVPTIRAIGDVIKGPMLAHKASDEGIAAVENIAAGHAVGHVNYRAIPAVTYTHPEVAFVGYTEEELKEEGIKYKIGKFPFRANSRARANDDSEGFVKFLADARTDKLLGVHILGPDAGELIGAAVFAIEYEASSEDFARTCIPHPTLSEAMRESAMSSAFGKCIHF